MTLLLRIRCGQSGYNDVIISSMNLKVRKIGNGYGVILPKPLMEDLAVSAGSLLMVENHDGVLHMTPVDEDFTRQVEAFLQTEGEHRCSYRELAK